MKTILIHDAKYSIFPDGIRFARTHQADVPIPYDPEKVIIERSEKSVEFRRFCKVINGEKTDVRLSCDPEIQELLGLQFEAFDNMEREVDRLRNYSENMKKQLSLLTHENNRLDIKLTEARDVIHKFECMSIFRFLIHKLKLRKA